MSDSMYRGVIIRRYPAYVPASTVYHSGRYYQPGETVPVREHIVRSRWYDKRGHAKAYLTRNGDRAYLAKKGVEETSFIELTEVTPLPAPCPECGHTPEGQ